MKIARMGVTFLLSFLFMMLLIVSELSIVTSSTLLNSQFYSKTLTQVGYYDQLGTELEKGFINIGLATGLPKEVLVNSIDRPWLERQGNSYIASLTDYLSLKSAAISYKFDNKTLEVKLSQTIVNYAQQIGTTISPEDLTELNDLLLNNVQQRVLVVDPQSPMFSSLRQYTGLIVQSRAYLIFASLFILLCLFLVNRKEPSEFMAWLAYSFISAGLLLVIPTFILRSSEVLNRLALHDLYLRQAVGALLGRYVDYILYAGLATIIVGILIVMASSKASPSNDPL